MSRFDPLQIVLASPISKWLARHKRSSRLARFVAVALEPNLVGATTRFQRSAHGVLDVVSALGGMQTEILLQAAAASTAHATATLEAAHEFERRQATTELSHQRAALRAKHVRQRELLLETAKRMDDRMVEMFAGQYDHIMTLDSGPDVASVASQLMKDYTAQVDQAVVDRHHNKVESEHRLQARLQEKHWHMAEQAISFATALHAHNQEYKGIIADTGRAASAKSELVPREESQARRRAWRRLVIAAMAVSFGPTKARSPQPEDVCYHCRLRGHWKVHCPRFLSGKPAADARFQLERAVTKASMIRGHCGMSLEYDSSDPKVKAAITIQKIFRSRCSRARQAVLLKKELRKCRRQERRKALLRRNHRAVVIADKTW